jgi:hypothetical protein
MQLMVEFKKNMATNSKVRYGDAGEIISIEILYIYSKYSLKESLPQFTAEVMILSRYRSRPVTDLLRFWVNVTNRLPSVTHRNTANFLNDD